MIYDLLIGRNSCAFCAEGSNVGGNCEPDKLDCENASPWRLPGFCRNDGYEGAGLNGCVNCEHMRTICSTSCNWCT